MDYKLDRRLTLRAPTSTKDDFGEETETFSDIATVWCGVDVKTGREITQASQEVAINEKSFIIRYRTDVDEKCILIYDEKTYDIISVYEIGRKRFLQIMAQKRDNES